MDTLLRLRHSLESPWIWNLPIPDSDRKLFILINTEKCSNLAEESGFQWSIFNLHLLLAYEVCQEKPNFDEALEHIRFCENHIDRLTVNNCQELLFTSIRTALLQVTFATKANILYLAQRSDKEVKECLEQAASYKIVNNKDKAGILGIKAGVCIQYGTNGHRLVLNFAKEALRLDPDQAEWHFLLGNSLGRIRRTENGKISDEEIAAIEKAYVLEKNAAYIVHLASMFAEISSDLVYSAYGNKDKLYKSKTFAIKAVQRYKEAIELRPNCPSLMARAAHGLLRIKFKEVLEVEYVKALLDNVVKMVPNNSMVYHDLGFYYENFEKDIGKAIQNLEKAHELYNEKAFLYLVLLKWKHGFEGEIINDIKEALQKYQQEESQAELLCRLGACCILVGQDLESAIKHFNESLAVDPSAKYLKNFRGFNGKKTNLLELLKKELLNQRYQSQNFAEFAEKSKHIPNHTAGNKTNRDFRNTLDNWKRDQLSAKTKKGSARLNNNALP